MVALIDGLLLRLAPESYASSGLMHRISSAFIQAIDPDGLKPNGKTHWLVDRVLGKIDHGPLFDEMSSLVRRRSNLRLRHIEKKMDFHLKKAKEASAKRDLATGARTASDIADCHLNEFLFFLYQTKKQNFEAPEEKIGNWTVEKYTDWLDPESNRTGAIFTNYIQPLLKQNPIVQKFAPKLFSDEFWQNFIYVKAKKAAAEKEEKIYADRLAAERKAQAERDAANQKIRDAEEQARFRRSPAGLARAAQAIAETLTKHFFSFQIGNISAIPNYTLVQIGIALDLAGGDLDAAKELLTDDYLNHYIATGEFQSRINAINYPNLSQAYRKYLTKTF